MKMIISFLSRTNENDFPRIVNTYLCPTEIVSGLPSLYIISEGSLRPLALVLERSLALHYAINPDTHLDLLHDVHESPIRLSGPLRRLGLGDSLAIDTVGLGPVDFVDHGHISPKLVAKPLVRLHEGFLFARQLAKRVTHLHATLERRLRLLACQPVATEEKASQPTGERRRERAPRFLHGREAARHAELEGDVLAGKQVLILAAGDPGALVTNCGGGPDLDAFVPLARVAVLGGVAALVARGAEHQDLVCLGGGDGRLKAAEVLALLECLGPFDSPAHGDDVDFAGDGPLDSLEEKKKNKSVFKFRH